MELAGEIAPPSGVASYPPEPLLGEGCPANSRGVLDSPQHSPPSTLHWTAKLAVFTITEQAENKSLINVLFLRKPGLLTE